MICCVGVSRTWGAIQKHEAFWRVCRLNALERPRCRWRRRGTLSGSFLEISRRTNLTCRLGVCDQRHAHYERRVVCELGGIHLTSTTRPQVHGSLRRFRRRAWTKLGVAHGPNMVEAELGTYPQNEKTATIGSSSGRAMDDQCSMFRAGSMIDVSESGSDDGAGQCPRTRFWAVACGTQRSSRVHSRQILLFGDCSRKGQSTAGEVEFVDAPRRRRTQNKKSKVTWIVRFSSESGFGRATGASQADSHVQDLW